MRQIAPRSAEARERPLVTSIDIPRTRVLVMAGDARPTLYDRVRFVFHHGRAAVWQENKAVRSAERKLLATEATFVRAESGQQPHMVYLPDGTQWQVSRSSGGCNCGSTLNAYPPDQLVSDDLMTITR